jgi:hypothetical protein
MAGSVGPVIGIPACGSAEVCDKVNGIRRAAISEMTARVLYLVSFKQSSPIKIQDECGFVPIL